MRTIACSAPPWTGGLGRHFGELLSALRAEQELARYYSTRVEPDAQDGEVVSLTIPLTVERLPPLRFRPSWRHTLENEWFDRAVARRLRRANVHVGFAGQALRSFAQARKLGAESLELVSATCHVAQAARRYDEAHRRDSLEFHWLGAAQIERTLREYELADVIEVTSDYSFRSFLEAGMPERKLRRTTLSVESRFRVERPPRSGAFRIVYVGGLSVAKGTPVLLEAFSRLSLPDTELVLVGGPSSRGMRRLLEEHACRDKRIRVAPGDPLPELLRADVYVHPSFQDGFGYSPMEALTLGLPVVVTEDTGMKEHVREGENGYVVQTGNAEALAERLVALAEARSHK